MYSQETLKSTPSCQCDRNRRTHSSSSRCTYRAQTHSFSFSRLLSLPLSHTHQVSLTHTQKRWYHLTKHTYRLDSVQYLLQHSCCYKSWEETRAGAIGKTQPWTQREQGGKIQEVLIQVQRQSESEGDGWCEGGRGMEGGGADREKCRLLTENPYGRSN